MRDLCWVKVDIEPKQSLFLPKGSILQGKSLATMEEIESCTHKYLYACTQKHTEVHVHAHSHFRLLSFLKSVNKSSNKAGDQGTTEIFQVGNEQNIVQSEL